LKKETKPVSEKKDNKATSNEETSGKEKPDLKENPDNADGKPDQLTLEW